MVLLLCVAVLSFFTGCEASTDSTSKTRVAKEGAYSIVTTCGMVTDIVRNVAGDRAQVVGIMGEGVDPHLYKPTRGDVKKLMDADVVFYSGLMLEGRMGDTFAKVARSGKPVFAVTEGIDETYLREPPEFAGHWDPHVWMDVAAWSKAVEYIAEMLAQYDPAHADEYRQRAAAYQAELKQLDDYTRQVIASVPAAQRYLITAHDAFGYFSRAYDIPVRSVQGISTESEAGVDDINELVDFLVGNQVPAIFVESSVSQKSVEAVREGARSKGHDVKIGGQLYSDAMGPAGSYEGTYLGMIDHNATTIARALGGEAPERGLHGKLALPVVH
ncbi:MAG: zinc ABC transporter substrate-binding protein [Pirellulales bacterium]|nr:zinc ABC transporter substrate-binding protein [Pirellulales bacterium]